MKYIILLVLNKIFFNLNKKGSLVKMSHQFSWHPIDSQESQIFFLNKRLRKVKQDIIILEIKTLLTIHSRAYEETFYKNYKL